MNEKSDGSVVFALGDSFDKKRHKNETNFEAYFEKKLKSLEYGVHYVDEYMTSQKCPHCFRKTSYVEGTYRVKHCHACDVHFHRDAMAGQNIAIRLLAGIHGQKVPYLERPAQKE